MNRISWAVLIVLLIVVLRLPTKTSGYVGDTKDKNINREIRRDIRRINRAFNRKRVGDIKQFEDDLKNLNTRNLKITDEQKTNDIINRINMIRGDSASTQPVDVMGSPPL